jgi:hypothetical protein
VFRREYHGDPPVEVLVPYVPIPVGAGSEDSFFDLFQDHGRTATDVENGPTGQIDVLATEVGAEALFFSSVRQGAAAGSPATAPVDFLQYWMFETYSSAPFNMPGYVPGFIIHEWPIVHHEGDLEHVQVALRLFDPSDRWDRSSWLQPIAVTASQHYYAQTVKWNAYDGDAPERAYLQTHVQHTENARFSVFVALGAHATYLAADPYIKSAQGPGEGVLGCERQYEIADPQADVYDQTCNPISGGNECSPGSVLPVENYSFVKLDQSGLFWEYLGRWGFRTVMPDMVGDKGPPGPQERTADSTEGPVSLLTEPCFLHNGAVRAGPEFDELRLECQ